MLNERIKKIRTDAGLTQEEFAKRLDVKRNTVATYEMGRSEPSAAVLSLICKTFSVNKEWLLTGLGDPYVKRTRNQEIQAYANTLMEDVDESFRKRFFLALSKLDESQWELLEQIMDTLKKD